MHSPNLLLSLLFDSIYSVATFDNTRKCLEENLSFIMFLKEDNSLTIIVNNNTKTQFNTNRNSVSYLEIKPGY